jgi:glutathione S-transferase
MVMLTLYQAEWCPFSSAVREVLTELGIDFVARQVEPWPEQRAGLRERSGSDLTPVLETEDGRFLHGTRAIFGYCRTKSRGSTPRPTAAASSTTATRASPTRPAGWSSTSARALGTSRPRSRPS